jgi:hypothetical protein
MANREKGEVAVEINGATYTLVLNFNSLIALQGLFSQPGALVSVEDIFRRANDGDLEYFRALFWATLRKYHKGITVEGAGDLIDAAGGIELLNAKLLEVGEASGPDPVDTAALGGGAANPSERRKRGRPRGTGGRSTSRRDEPE